jgi:hypothetical protein
MVDLLTGWPERLVAASFFQFLPTPQIPGLTSPVKNVALLYGCRSGLANWPTVQRINYLAVTPAAF